MMISVLSAQAWAYTWVLYDTWSIEDKNITAPGMPSDANIYTDTCLMVYSTYGLETRITSITCGSGISYGIVYVSNNTAYLSGTTFNSFTMNYYFDYKIFVPTTVGGPVYGVAVKYTPDATGSSSYAAAGYTLTRS